MANKKNTDFTSEERSYDPIGMRETSSTSSTTSGYSDIANIQNSSEETGRRSYKKLDIRGEVPEEYRITLKMRGELGMYVAAKAYFNLDMDRSQVIIDLIEEDMKKNPQIMKELEKLRKKK